MHRLNQTADVMAEHLAECFVNLCRLCPATQSVAELRLYHAERGFNVAALVIILHEPLLIVREVVIHLLPQRAMPLVMSHAVSLERNVRHRRIINYRLEVAARQVSLICAHLVHYEVLCGRLNQWLEAGAISGVTVSNLNCRHHVRFHSAHQMDFYPLPLIYQLGVCSILGVHPLHEPASRKTRTINREVLLYRAKRQAAFLNQHLQVRRAYLILEIVEYGVIAGQLRDITFAVRVFQVSHKAAARDGRIDLEGHCENHIFQRQATLTSAVLCGTSDTLTELVE